MPNTVKELGNLVFSGCTNLSEVQLFNKIELIPGEAFHYCEKLHKLIIPEGVKMLDDFSIAGIDNLQIFLLASLETTSQTAFYGSRIEKIELDSNNQNLVCNSGILYNTNRNLMYAVEKKNIEIDSNNPTFLSINGQICSKDRKKLYMCYSKNGTVTLEEGIETIGESAFVPCNSFIINFPTTLQSLPFNSLNGMKNVKSIKLGKMLIIYQILYVCGMSI